VFSNWRDWVKRYGWAEFWGTIASYCGYFIVLWALGSRLGGAYGAAVAENVGFYGCILVRDMLRHRREGHAISVGLAFTLAHGMVFEFGFAELLDFFVVRPAATYFAVTLFGATLGVLIGKAAADLVFYSLAIGFYERRKAREGAQ
jgi:hypothetical protein